jgi:hypothetical protein
MLLMATSIGGVSSFLLSFSSLPLPPSIMFNAGVVAGVNRRVSAESWPKTLGVGASTYAISARKKMVVRRRYSA